MLSRSDLGVTFSCHLHLVGDPLIIPLQVCLSISSHHPEHWQPSWSVRTALTALIAFMPTPGNGAIGSLVRRVTAQISECGPPDDFRRDSRLQIISSKQNHVFHS